MNLIRQFDSVIERMSQKNWDCIYILIDLHGTIFVPAYNKEEQYIFYPYAKETLQLMSECFAIKIILWSSTCGEWYSKYLKVLNDSGIFPDYFNENPEVVREESDPIQVSYDIKPYYNIGIDDKFGFEPSDWKSLYKYLKKLIKNNVLQAI